MSRVLRFYYDILLEFGAPVTGHAFTLQCIPPSFPGQEILDVTLELDPQVPYARQKDGFGNLLQIGRVEAPHSRFRYTVRGTARLDRSRRQAEACHPVFRFPSAYTAAIPEMEAYLRGLRLPVSPADRAWALAQAVRARMTYTPGETGVATTAPQAFASGRGVCQDFAHVYLALARQAGLAARYVNGLPEGEGASHAWCEVWLDGRWTGIDPTRGRWTDEGYIRFGVGRDFGDCPMERGVFLGLAEQKQTVFMQVREQQ
ncbi:MAG: transglutaminase family protein [Dysosmobacter sp.]|nr:transglutaminase family protein [Dysosmobacter sp.]